MNFIIVSTLVIICLAQLALAGFIHHHEEEQGGGGAEHGHGATSYQSIKREHYKAVPVYIKDKDASKHHHEGSAHHDVKIKHGHGKHDHGHAIVSSGTEGGHHHEEHHIEEPHHFEGHGGEEQQQEEYIGHIGGEGLGHYASSRGDQLEGLEGYEGLHGYEGQGGEGGTEEHSYEGLQQHYQHEE